MSDETPELPTRGNPWLAGFLAWVIPGLGHFYLGRRARGVAFLLILSAALGVGVLLEGRLYHFLAGQPLSYAATLGTAGSGLLYGLLRFFHYEGNTSGAGFEYGAAFLLSAGLMNLLLVLDAWDIARGEKE